MFNSPWNIQTKLVVNMAMIVEGIFEIVFDTYVRLPGITCFFTDREWWCLTFRVELFVFFGYLLMRLYVTALSFFLV